MRTIKCKGCGKIVQVNKDQAMCKDCRRKVKQASVIRPRTCIVCRSIFDGGPRASYCPACRDVRKKQAKKAYQQRKAVGNVRPIGSTDICANCGCEYTVNSGLQRYCPACAEVVVADTVNAHAREYAATEAQRAKRAERKRELAEDRKVCVICGNPIQSHTTTVTCSPECADIRLRELRRRADKRRNRRKWLEKYGVPGT